MHVEGGCCCAEVEHEFAVVTRLVLVRLER